MATIGSIAGGSESRQPKKSLILAGGGLKVAFQAGVMQVWLDEAKLHFDHADGASGGCFNLAMYCQGMSGKQIADNWRTLDPTAGVSFNWLQYVRLFFARSLFTLDAYRKNVFPKWGLDWHKIRATETEASFNLYNFSKHRLEIVGPRDMDEDRLCASVSLPMWFPPTTLGGDTYIDAVYATDSNLEEAIRRGADEIWVIWTVSERGQWDDGFVANYFQIIEASANSHFRAICNRIEVSNSAIATGNPGEFGRRIALKILRSEVSLNYLINFSRDRVAEAVNHGVLTAREWCRQNGVSFGPLPDATSTHPISLEFTEEMKGFIAKDETDYDRGLRVGQTNGTKAMVHLTIRADDVNRFIDFPQHEASATGYFACDAYGGKCPVLQGVFNLLVDNQSPDRKAMYYRLFFADNKGNPLTLLGYKDIRSDDHRDVWTDTTTLYTRILKGHVGPEGDGGANIVAAGIIHIHILDFLHQLTTFKVNGSTPIERISAIKRFGTLFLGKLWDVYAHHVLPASPF